MKPGRGWTVAIAASLPMLLLVTGCGRSRPLNSLEVDPSKPAPALSGVNWDGKPFRLSDHRGKVVIVFFGYTYCPDVCPFTLAKMKQLYSRLGPRAGSVEVVFVSIDPGRDSVAKLAQYVPSFDRRFYGLYIPAEDLGNATRAFEVTVQYGQPTAGGLETDNYYVDHTANFFVVDRWGKLRLKFPPSVTADQMLADIEPLLAT